MHTAPILLILVTLTGLTGRAALAPTNLDKEAAGETSSLRWQTAKSRPIAHTREEQSELHEKCVKAEERAERQAGAMVPGRTWTWALDADRSLQQLDELRRDLSALKESEGAFEASLTPEQVSEFQTQVHRMNQLSRHLERDVDSLDNELRKGYPRRWHVANDALDIQKEIHRWRRLHDEIAAKMARSRPQPVRSS